MEFSKSYCITTMPNSSGLIGHEGHPCRMLQNDIYVCLADSFQLKLFFLIERELKSLKPVFWNMTNVNPLLVQGHAPLGVDHLLKAEIKTGRKGEAGLPCYCYLLQPFRHPYITSLLVKITAPIQLSQACYLLV